MLFRSHHLPDRFHVGGEGGVRRREFLEGEPGNLDHHVVEGGFEGRGGDPGDVVGDLVEGVSDCDLGGDLRNRETGGLGRERRTPYLKIVLR